MIKAGGNGPASTANRSALQKAKSRQVRASQGKSHFRHMAAGHFLLLLLLLLLLVLPLPSFLHPSPYVASFSSFHPY